jgi:cytochrome c-type biogenesis protein
MSLIPDIANPYTAALVGGFVYGVVACTPTCLPYIAGYIAGINAGFRRGITATVTFNLGRITAYAIIGAAVGAFKFVLDESLTITLQSYMSIAFSIVTVAIGVLLLVRYKEPACNCAAEAKTVPGKQGFTSRFDFSAYTLGFSRGLILCAPMLALVGYAIVYASPVDSVLLATLFGVGTAVSPIILLAGATGWLLNKAPLFRKWISRLGAVSLIALGAITLVNTIII